MKTLNVNSRKVAILAGLILSVSYHATSEEMEQVSPVSPVSLVTPKQLSTEEIEARREENRKKLLASIKQTDFVKSDSDSVGGTEFLNKMIENKEKTGSVTTEETFSPPKSLVDLESKPKKMSFIDKVKSQWKPNQSFELKPAGNIAVPVAAGLTNRIATNFNMLAVKTHDENSVIELEDGMMYITLKSLSPVGIMLFEEGVPDSMVNLTLFPFDGMLPTMVDLDIAMTPRMIKRGDDFRKSIEKTEALEDAAKSFTQDKGLDKYTARIEHLLTTIAKQEIPNGFTLSTEIDKKSRMYPCSMPIKNVIAQRIIGGREIVDVVLVTNDSPYIYTVQEQHCYQNDALAAAVFQRATLQPGQSTEMYILRDKLYFNKVSQKKSRPTLIK